MLVATRGQQPSPPPASLSTGCWLELPRGGSLHHQPAAKAEVGGGRCRLACALPSSQRDGTATKIPAKVCADGAGGPPPLTGQLPARSPFPGGPVVPHHPGPPQGETSGGQSSQEERHSKDLGAAARTRLGIASTQQPSRAPQQAAPPPQLLPQGGPAQPTRRTPRHRRCPNAQPSLLSFFSPSRRTRSSRRGGGGQPTPSSVASTGQGPSGPTSLKKAHAQAPPGASRTKPPSRTLVCSQCQSQGGRQRQHTLTRRRWLTCTRLGRPLH